MGNRDLYFEKHIRNTKTPEAYLQALVKSPYKTHRRMAIALQSQYEELKKAHDKVTKKD